MQLGRIHLALAAGKNSERRPTYLLLNLRARPASLDVQNRFPPFADDVVEELINAFAGIRRHGDPFRAGIEGVVGFDQITER